MTDNTPVPASKCHSRRDASWCSPVKADLSVQVKGWLMSTVVNITRVRWPLQRKNMGSNRFPEVNATTCLRPLWTKMFLLSAIKRSSWILYLWRPQSLGGLWQAVPTKTQWLSNYLTISLTPCLSSRMNKEVFLWIPTISSSPDHHLLLKIMEILNLHTYSQTNPCVDPNTMTCIHSAQNPIIL